MSYYAIPKGNKMICTYCQTEQEQKKICSFCGTDLLKNRPKMKQNLSQEEAYQSQPILATYHTYDLMLLIQYLRAERSDAYKLMQMVRKAPEDVSVPSDTISFAEQQYRENTAHMKVIEGILIDRLGYKPKRIDNKLLQSLENKIQRSNSNEKTKNL